MDVMDVLVLSLIVCLFFSTFVAETMNVGLCCFGTFSPLSLPIFLLKEKERKETADRPWHCYVEKITGDLANARILDRSARYAQRIG